MTEITVLDYDSVQQDIFKLSPVDLEQYINSSFDERVAAGGSPIEQSTVAMLILIIREQSSATRITREDILHIVQSPTDIALRETLRILGGAKSTPRVLPIAHDVSTLAEFTGGASIKMFRPFMAKQRPQPQSSEPGTSTPAVALIQTADAVEYYIGDEKYVAAAQSPLKVTGLRFMPSADGDIAFYTLPNGFGQTVVGGEAVDAPIGTSTDLGDIVQIGRRLQEWGVVRGGDRRWNVHFAARNWPDLAATGTDAAMRLIRGLRNIRMPPSDAGKPLPAEVGDGAFFDLVRSEFGRVSTLQINMIGELTSYGLIPAYIASLYVGADDDRTRDLFDRQAVVRRGIMARAMDEHTRLAERERFAMRMHILSRILSTTRYAIVRRADNETTLARTLTKAELEQLNVEYAAQIKYALASLNNKCGHIPLYKQFRAAESMAVKKAAWSSLATYVSEGNASRNKGAGARSMYVCKLCGFPLVCPHYIEYVGLVASSASARDIRTRMNAYVMDGSEADAQKCRICYEIMFSRFDLSDDIVADDNADDEIRRAVYIEVSQFMTHVVFKTPIDLVGLISQLRDVIYPYAVRIDVDLRRMQSLSTSDVITRRNAFTAMIVAAKVVQLIKKTPTMYFERAPKLRLLKDLVEFAAKIVASTKTIILREIPGITQTVIRDRIMLGISAFGDGGDVRLEAEASETPESFEEKIRESPTYQWIALATGSSKFTRVMGGTPAEILKSVGKGESVYKRVDVGRQVLYKSPYLTQIYREHIKYVKAGGKAYKVDAVIPNAPSPALAHESWKWNTDRRRGALRLCATATITGNRRFDDRRVPIGVIYDENGALHVFNKYTIGDGAYTVDEMLKAAEVPAGGWRAALGDMECSVCGVRKSVAGKLDPARVRAGIAAASDVDSFYRFYEQKCPKGDLHAFAKNAKTGATLCGKCGMNITWTLAGRGDAAMNYYRANKDAFHAERANLTGATASVAPAPVVTTAPVPPPPKWSEHFADIVAIAEIGGVHPRLIQAFGAYAGTTTDAISNGSFTPPHTNARDDTRVYQVNSIVRATLSAWDRIRNYNRIKNHTAYTVETIGKTPRSLLDGLIDVSTGFGDLYTYFYWNEKPERTVSMCIQEWCTRLLAIYNVKDSETEHLRHTFVRSQIKNTIEGQELFTERQPFNWSIIYGKKDAPDLIEDFDPTEESVTRDKLFSTDAFDMDDTEVTIRVGEDRGLN